MIGLRNLIGLLVLYCLCVYYHIPWGCIRWSLRLDLLVGWFFHRFAGRNR